MTGRLAARVLIVDDNPEDAATYVRWLGSSPDDALHVATASSLEAAIEACAGTKAPDCLLLDYDLRASTGLEVIAELARRGLRPAIVAMTGSGSEAIAVDFLTGGASNYLIKSQMSAETLRTAIHAQLANVKRSKRIARAGQRRQTVERELRADLERATFLAAADRRLALSPDLSATLIAAAELAVPFLADVCTIDLVSDGNSPYSVAPDTDEPTARAQGTGLPVYLAGRPFTDAARAHPGLGSLARSGIRGAAFVPLRHSDLSMGVVSFGMRSARRLTSAQRQFLGVYARRIALAVMSVHMSVSDRLLDERSDSAQRRLVLLQRISSLFTGEFKWTTALPKLLKLLTISLSDSAAIFSVDERTRDMRLIGADSREPEVLRIVRRYYTESPPHIDDAAGPGKAARSAMAQFAESQSLAALGNDVSTDPGRARLRPWAPVSEIAIPLIAGGSVIAIIVLIQARSKKAFRSQDVAVAEEVGRRVSTHLESRRRYDHERGIATLLQHALLPPGLPALTDLLFAVRYFPGAAGLDVGGDWYDVVDVSPERLVVTIGDVIGSGAKAAAATSQFRDILRAYAFESFNPAAALTRLNDLINAQGGEQFATCAMLVLDRRKSRITYALAGHPPPLLRLPGGDVLVLDEARSMPIGAWHGTNYIEATIDMPAGSTLVLYTDGLVETRRRSAADGVDLLKDALRRSPWELELMLETLLKELEPDRSDDIAMLAIEQLAPATASLRRWAFTGVDRATVDVIRTEFDALIEPSAAGSDVYGARVILDELLANIVRHAPGAFRLELDWTSDAPTLRLQDNGPGFSVHGDFPGPDDLLSTTGRGLFLVARLGANLTIVRRPAGGLATSVVLPLRRRVTAQPAAALSTM